MKPLFLTISLSLTILLNGCALLSFRSMDEDFESDPIARAAMALRSPSSEDWIGSSSSATSRGLDRSEEEESTIQRALSSGQLTLGMDMNEVRSLWGMPAEIETAGDPYAGNQRWIYHIGLSSRWSVGKSRVVYFEGGRVAGWETAR